ncbi:MAG TPA: hypothetical protein VF990_14635 [Candidatus Dormibacteraeota bacterium]
MALSSWDILDLVGAPLIPWGELRLVSRLLDEHELVSAAGAPPVLRPALVRAA